MQIFYIVMMSENKNKINDLINECYKYDRFVLACRQAATCNDMDMQYNAYVQNTLDTTH